MLEYNIDVNSKDLDIRKTFDCGQCFRWKILGNNQCIGVVDGKFVWIIRIDNNTISVKTDGMDKTKLIEYLGLNDDYNKIDSLDLNDFEMRAKRSGQGIRILHQDPWEASVSFIISQRNNIPKIKSTIEKLCSRLGNRVELDLGNTKTCYYVFPTAEQIVTGGIGVLNECGLGYRSEYVLQLAKEYVGNKNLFNKYFDKSISSEYVVSDLMKHRGIGPKVANCIALFGLNRLDMFPIDVWIQRVIDEYYDGHIDISRFGEFAGVIQQYIFYYVKYVG